MTPIERQRAGEVIAARIESRGRTIAEVAALAGVDERTVRSLIAGTRWPSARNRRQIEQALDWPPGEIYRQGADGIPALSVFADRVLLHELHARAEKRGDVKEAATLAKLLHTARERDPECVGDKTSLTDNLRATSG